MIGSMASSGTCSLTPGKTLSRSHLRQRRRSEHRLDPATRFRMAAMRVGRGSILFAMLVLTLGTRPARGQEAVAAILPTSDRPFEIGEKLTYAVRVGPLGKGT